VLEEVVTVLRGVYDRVAFRIVRSADLLEGPSAGNPIGTASTWPIELEGRRIGEVEVGPASGEDDAFMRRVATIVAPYCKRSQ
jgi:hypothetical protein